MYRLRRDDGYYWNGSGDSFSENGKMYNDKKDLLSDINDDSFDTVMTRNAIKVRMLPRHLVRASIVKYEEIGHQEVFLLMSGLEREDEYITNKI